MESSKQMQHSIITGIKQVKQSASKRHAEAIFDKQVAADEALSKKPVMGH